MIDSFVYSTPTELIFGKGVIKDLPEVLSRYGKTVLMTYGGGSIKKLGIYDKIKELLKDFTVIELADVILAVGGGSVLDCSKAIAVSAKYDGEGWDLISGKVLAKDALPIVDVLTLAATGSEYDMGCVISNTALSDKRGYLDPHMYPAVSFLDPEYTYSVSPWQTACGTADAINHVLEQFFASPHSLFNDGVMISALRSLMTNVKITLKDPTNYAARSELMYVCSWGCNGILANGAGYSGWPMHSIEHALSAYFDITHGAGLAIITPRWMKEILSERTAERFVTLGTDLFGFDPALPAMEMAEKVIDAFYAFFEETGIPMHLGALGVTADKIDEMADHILTFDSTNEPWMYAPLDKAALLRILNASM